MQKSILFLASGPNSEDYQWEADNTKSVDAEIRYNLDGKPDGTYHIYAIIDDKKYRWQANVDGGSVIFLKNLQ